MLVNDGHTNRLLVKIWRGHILDNILGMSHLKRWAVTYTRHVKQKRKVYQDGVLELNTSARKVVLYDDGDKLIDSRSLKKDEIIEIGGSLTFEAHLVDIGDLEPTNLENCSAEGANFKLTETRKQGKKEILEHISPTKLPKNVFSNGLNCSKKEKPLSSENKSTVFRTNTFNSLNVESSSAKEWNVLYTSQITQKEKKYHDGILRVKQCDSCTSQVILMSEDGSLLSNKYLKSVESVKSGSNCDFPNYLVEICEPRLSPEENAKESPLKQIPSSSCSSNIKLTRTFNLQEKAKKPPPKIIETSSCTNNIKLTSTCKLQGNSEKPPLKEISSSSCLNKIELTKDKQKGGFDQIVDSTISKFVWGQQANKPLRDVCGILSTLKKPSQQDKHDDNKLVGKIVDSSPSSGLIFLDMECQKSTELIFSMKNYLWENVDASDKYISTEGATQGNHCKLSNSQMEQKSDMKDFHEKDISFTASGGGRWGSDIVSLPGNNEGNLSLLNITKDDSDVSRQCLEENVAAGATKDFSDTSHTGASRVDPILQQLINQTNTTKQEEICRAVQELDVSAVTCTVSDNSDFQILSNECVYADDIPTFDLGF